MQNKDLSMWLFLLGSLLFVIPNSGITGSAVGVFGIDDALIVLSALFFAASFFLGVVSRNRYHYYDVKTLVEKILGEDDTIVVDTSAIINRIDDFEDLVDKYLPKGKTKTDQVVIPARVLRELGRKKENDPLINKLKGKTQKPVHPKKMDSFLSLAEKYLSLTPKAQTFFECIDYVERMAKGIGPHPSLSRGKIEKIELKLRPVFAKIKGEIKHDLGKLPKSAKYSLARDFLHRHYEPSKTDINVLATALYMVRHPRKSSLADIASPTDRKIARTTVIFSRDTDFREAIKLIKDGYTGINPATNRKVKIKPHPEIASLLEYKEPGKWVSPPVHYVKKSSFKRKSTMPSYH